ncbi:MAG: hypothetical protein ACLS3C_11115 [Oscillospiraceae bacterium]
MTEWETAPAGCYNDGDLHGGRVNLQYTRHSGIKRTAEKLPAAHDREG